MIVTPAANATAVSGSVGGKAILSPRFSAAAGKRGMSNEIALPPSLSLDKPGDVWHRSTAEGPLSVALAANATVALGSVGGKVILPP